MIITVDSTSSIPLYVQIVEQVKRAIASGILIKGEVLPSRRKLAAQLDINPLTVQNAYKALAEEGLIEIKQGLGCFVAASEPAVDKYRTHVITKAVDQLILNAQAFDIPLPELDEMVRKHIERARDEDRNHEKQLGVRRADEARQGYARIKY